MTRRNRQRGWRSRQRGWLLGLALVIALVAAACGGGDTPSTGGGTSQQLSGSVAIDGSSTVAPVSEAVAEEFKKQQSGVNVTVGTSGTGGGFKKFCSGETDISDASRAIKDEEKTACQSKQIEYTEFRIGLDGLAVVTSAQNTFLDTLTFEQLAKIYEKGGATTWNQVDPKFPNEKIAIFGPGTDSGTYDFFVEQVLGVPDEPGSKKPRSDYTDSEDDNTLVQGVEGQKNSIGYFGYAYFAGNKDRLKDIKVSKEAGPGIEPNDQTVASGDYPLSRPLFIYAKNTSLAKPEVRGFVKFYLEQTPALIKDVGYVQAPAQDYQDGLAKLNGF